MKIKLDNKFNLKNFLTLMKDLNKDKLEKLFYFDEGHDEFLDSTFVLAGQAQRFQSRIFVLKL